jgi:beta-galactosidase/beta-glucuronidase
MSEGTAVTDRAWPSTTIDLKGTWQLVIGEHSVEELSSLRGQDIEVPGLWEAQGYLGLDGTAWCRRSFDLAGTSGWWTLHFGAVMDDADVFVNGDHVGFHRGGFTPFALDCTGAVRAGTNDIAVRIVDHPRGSPEHSRSAHGKQGWMNEVFPSPPSLYLDYGGIWQAVSLEQHGPLSIVECWANSDPDELVAVASLAGAIDRPVRLELAVLGTARSGTRG